MKKLSFAFIIALFVFLFVGFTACNDKTADNTGGNTNGNNQNITDDENTSGDAANDVLITYFSRTGENWEVGNISEGNTAIIAKMIAEVTGGDLFEIVPVVPYPNSYSDMLNVAQEEVNTNARPAIQSTVPNFESYDVIFLGYPIWNGNCPNIMLTFMESESYDFTGKTVIPFCTHGGSSLGSSVGTIKSKLTTATVLDGLAITGTTAQNDRSAARSQVESFIEGLNMNFGSSMAKYDFSEFTNVEVNADLDGMSGEQLEILYLQAKYCQAMTEADTDTMRELTSENMTFTHMSGKQQTRDEYFADVKSGALRYFTIGIDSPTVTVNGTSASISYTSVLNANAYGARGTYRMSGTHPYEKQNGKWIAVNDPNK